MSLKVVQLFHTYPLLYQPYLKPVINELYKSSDINFNVMTFEGNSNDCTLKVPVYHKRRVYERLTGMFNKKHKTFNYVEHYCLKNQIDILHIQDSFLFPNVLKLLDLPKENGPILIMTMRGNDTYLKPLVYDKWKEFYHKHANKFDAFIAMSQNQKEKLIHLGVEASKIWVIPISLVPSKSLTTKIPDSKQIRITSAFRLVWEKNVEGNLRVIKILKDQGYNVNYRIYGSGHQVRQIYFLLDKYQISDSVEIIGNVSHETLKSSLLKSDFYLQLSHSESLGMSVIEAQSNGLPGIVSNSGGLPEAIKEGLSGYCVDAWDSEKAADYIIKLFRDAELYSSFSKAAIDYSNDHYSNRREVGNLLKLYKSLNLKK